MLRNLLKTMRPRQWSKNLLVFLPLVFTLKQYWQPFSVEMYEFFGIATAAFTLFCILSSVIYLVNDLVDIEMTAHIRRSAFDRSHRARSPSRRLSPRSLSS